MPASDHQCIWCLGPANREVTIEDGIAKVNGKGQLVTRLPIKAWVCNPCARQRRRFSPKSWRDRQSWWAGWWANQQTRLF